MRTLITRSKHSGGKFSSGKNAVGICHRSGFKVPYKDLVFEPGTNYFVAKGESDGKYSLVSHPQNYPPDKKVERVALRWSSFDVALSIGTVVSADQLGLPSHASTFFTSTGTITSVGSGVSTVVSTGTGVSGESLDFSSINNSMYYVIIFQGI